MQHRAAFCEVLKQFLDCHILSSFSPTIFVQGIGDVKFLLVTLRNLSSCTFFLFDTPVAHVRTSIPEDLVLM